MWQDFFRKYPAMPFLASPVQYIWQSITVLNTTFSLLERKKQTIELLSDLIVEDVFFPMRFLQFCLG